MTAKPAQSPQKPPASFQKQTQTVLADPRKAPPATFHQICRTLKSPNEIHWSGVISIVDVIDVYVIELLQCSTGLLAAGLERRQRKNDDRHTYTSPREA